MELIHSLPHIVKPGYGSSDYNRALAHHESGRECNADGLHFHYLVLLTELQEEGHRPGGWVNLYGLLA